VTLSTFAVTELRLLLIFIVLAMIRIKFKSSMLEYSKLILSKMTFDKKLFKKEFRKAFRYLNREERRHLIRWVRSKSELVGLVK
jgi:hypothetical protein